ncbi:cytochrome P450 [Hypoxylon sp. NC1633]|nr:cytochrome P450 [Hypoxylon sp. NC1633]
MASIAFIDFVLSLVEYGALIYLPYLLLLFSYRLFFHPLKDYPGPFTAKLTNLYAGFTPCSVIRHGPNKLIFNSAQALRDIYNSERVTKSDVYLLTIASGKPSVFSTLDKHTGLGARAINDKAMRAFEPTMIDQVDIFINQLLASSRGSNPVDMTDHCKRLGMDIVGLLAFGFPLNMQTQETNRFMLRGLAIGTYQNNCFMQFPLLKKLGLHNALLLLGYSQRMRYKRILQTMIKSRLLEGIHSRNDLYSFVVDHLDNSADGMTTTDLWGEALFFFPAGGDTTSTAISALFFYLSRNRHVYTKLADEIRSTFGSNFEIRGQKLNSCHYLRACINEALRMSPPVTGTLWRQLYPDERQEPFIIDGHVVPPGTEVGVCTYSLHHNEDYFPDPFVFLLERWLVVDEDDASLVIAKTLWHFDFEIAPGKIGEAGQGVSGKVNGRGRLDEFQLFDTFGSRHVGPNLVFYPRSKA